MWKIVCPEYCYNIFYKEMHVISKELNDLHYLNEEILLKKNQECDISGQNIILFGYQHIKSLSEFLKKNKVILYNLEQLIFHKWDIYISHWIYAFHIWDYSQINIDYVKKNNFPAMKHTLLEIGYSKYYEKEFDHDNTNNTDIIFIGNMSERRKWFLTQLMNVRHIEHVYFDYYQNIVNENKYFLNIHYQEPAILEEIRIIPLLCNRKVIFSERGCDDYLNKKYDNVIYYLEDLNYDLINFKNYEFNHDKFSVFMKEHNFNENLKIAMKRIQMDHSPDLKICVATLHCNDRLSIFDTIDSFLKSINFSFINLEWIILSQGCSSEHNHLLEKKLENMNHRIVVMDTNLGWSKGMNLLYTILLKKQYDLVLHLEDDWICRDGISKEWLSNCIDYMKEYTDVSSLFLRHYKNDKEKHHYGWTRNINYQCFQYPNPFNYAEKMKNKPSFHFKNIILTEIPEFLYTANPTLFRLQDYKNCNVFPFYVCNDTSNNRIEWENTLITDAPDWGISEAYSMEKIRNLKCMYVNDGIFYHKF